MLILLKKNDIDIAFMSCIVLADNLLLKKLFSVEAWATLVQSPLRVR